jgi:hypothetical protein
MDVANMNYVLTYACVSFMDDGYLFACVILVT